jgi:hypothetical protein
MSQNVTCSCSFHGVSNTEYASQNKLAEHLNLVQHLSCFAFDDLMFLGSTLLETRTLKRYGLVINTQYRLLLCFACEAAIIPSQLKSHLSKNHTIKLEDTDRSTIVRLLTVCKIHLSTLPELHHSIISEIEGLPLREGHPCPSESCLTVGITYESLKAHMRQKHRGMAYPLPNAMVHAQQLKTGTHNQLIRIHVAEELPIRLSNADILAQSAALLSAGPSVPVSLSHDPREYCPWLRNVRWQDLSLGKDVVGLVALVEHPKKDEFPLLSDGLLHLLSLASSKFDCTSELILQRLNTPKPVDECVLFFF